MLCTYVGKVIFFLKNHLNRGLTVQEKKITYVVLIWTKSSLKPVKRALFQTLIELWILEDPGLLSEGKQAKLPISI